MNMTPPAPPPSRVRLPCLAFNRGKYSDAPVLFNLSERKAVPSDMDELRGNTAWPTPHGWFLVRRPGTPATTTFLWNPSSNGGDKIQLPPLQEDVPDDCTCLLSDKPTAGGCVVLLLDRMDPIMWYCHAGGGEGEGWARHEYDIGTQILYPDETLHEKLVIAPAASCHGNFYFSTGSFEELGVIEFRATTKPEFSSVAVREVVGAGEVYGVAHSALVFMVESKERLHMVNLLFEGSFSNVVYEVSVYRMDLATQQWCRVYDLDGQAFLLSATRFGASRPAADCGLEEDCVYVAYPWDRGLMVYNIKEGTMNVETIDEAPESGAPLWMLPAS
ncbi:unnamed protein product [Urochloa humidicola]